MRKPIVNSPSTTTGICLGRTDSQNGRMRWIHNGNEVIDIKATQITHCKRRTIHIGGLHSTVTRTANHAFVITGNFGDARYIGVFLHDG